MDRQPTNASSQQGNSQDEMVGQAVAREYQPEAQYSSTKEGKKKDKKSAWRDNFQGLKPDLIRNKLVHALKKKDRGALERSIREAEGQGLSSEDCVELAHAERQLDVLLIKEELNKAIQSKDVDEIIEVLEKVRDRLDEDDRRQHTTSRGTVANTTLSNTQVKSLPKLESYRNQLAYELQQARTVLRVAATKPSSEPRVLKLEPNTISEIKAFKAPPQGLKNVMTATFILLGEDEATAQDWGKCLRMCSTLYNRILDFDPDSVDPSKAARAKQIINSEDFDNIKCVSAGAATFYVWVKGTLEEYEETHSLESVTPSGRKKPSSHRLPGPSRYARPARPT